MVQDIVTFRTRGYPASLLGRRTLKIQRQIGQKSVSKNLSIMSKLKKRSEVEFIIDMTIHCNSPKAMKEPAMSGSRSGRYHLRP